jgi:hypothetical protein
MRRAFPFTEKVVPKDLAAVIIIWGFCIGFVSFWVGVAWVIIHFIVKFW